MSNRPEDPAGTDEKTTSGPLKPEDDIRNRPMPTEDKVFFSIIGIVFVLFMIGGLYVLAWFMENVVGASPGLGTGVGLQGAFISAFVISVVLSGVFALVAGDGIVGELTSLVIFFFLSMGFFTLSIALIL